MASLLGSLGQVLTPDVVGALGRAVGQDNALVQKGLDVVGPLVLGSLAKKSETTSGLDSIMRMVPQDGGAGFLGNVVGALGQQDPLSSAGLLGSVLGPGVSAIGKTLSGRLGFDVTPLLSAVAPTVLNVISKTAKEQKLNSVDIAKMLQADRSATVGSATPEVQAMVNEALHIGDRAERLRSTFTDDEWTKIRLAPLATTYYVMSASASGGVGTTKELLAAGDAMKALVKDALPTSLVDVAFGSLGGKLDADSTLDKQSPRHGLVTTLQAATAAVKVKSPADAKSFGDTLVALSRKVAEASREGGFLGIGGTKVSKEEEQAIAEIAAAVA
jgi:hypothetical protein